MTNPLSNTASYTQVPRRKFVLQKVDPAGAIDVRNLGMVTAQLKLRAGGEVAIVDTYRRDFAIEIKNLGARRARVTRAAWKTCSTLWACRYSKPSRFAFVMSRLMYSTSPPRAGLRSMSTPL